MRIRTAFRPTNSGQDWPLDLNCVRLSPIDYHQLLPNKIVSMTTDFGVQNVEALEIFEFVKDLCFNDTNERRLIRATLTGTAGNDAI